MDLYNNAQGREIGENVSKYNIYKEVLNAVRKGELKKIENGKLVPTNNGMVISAI